MIFWIVAGAIATGIAALMALAVLRSRGTADALPAGQSDIQVYRDQLKDVERDIARGVLSAEEGQAVRTEVSRRLLAADKRAQDAASDAPAPASGAKLVSVIILGVVVIGGTFTIYTRVGAPGYPDLPLQARLAAAEETRETRPGQVEAEADYAAIALPLPEADPRHLELVEELRRVVAERPEDATGQQLLARNEASLGNFVNAREAQARMIEILGENARPGDYADLADLMILATGGYVSPEAEDALNATLQREPTNGTALYYYGLMFAQTGRPDRTFALWRPLLENSTPDQPWYAPLRGQIGEIAQLAGVRYELPPVPEMGGPRGPSAEDIENAGQMSAEDRQAMIEGMVGGLMDRLATQGGPVEEWVQLIDALGVLGRLEQAQAISDEALVNFAAQPDALPLIRDARARLGIGE